MKGREIFLFSTITTATLSLFLIVSNIGVTKGAGTGVNCNTKRPKLNGTENYHVAQNCPSGTTYNTNTEHCHCWSYCGYICDRKVAAATTRAPTVTTRRTQATTVNSCVNKRPTFPPTSHWVSDPGCSRGSTYNTNTNPEYHCHCWSYCGYICDRRTPTPTPNSCVNKRPTFPPTSYWVSDPGCRSGTTYDTNTNPLYHCHCWSFCGYICDLRPAISTTQSSLTTTGSTTVSGGSTTTSGGGTTASGGSTTASGGSTTASGGSTTASGGSTTASGGSTTASGGSTTAFGGSTTTSGGSTTSSGSSTTANPISTLSTLGTTLLTPISTLSTLSTTSNPLSTVITTLITPISTLSTLSTTSGPSTSTTPSSTSSTTTGNAVSTILTTLITPVSTLSTLSPTTTLGSGRK